MTPSSTEDLDDPNKPVVGYPTSYPPPNPSHSSTTVYPPAYIGYPYPAAPGSPPPNPPPRRKPCLRPILLSSITIFLLFTIITFIVWLLFRPSLPEFRLDSATIPPSNISTLDISPNWEIGFLVKNPNTKLTILYDGMEAAVFYGDETLCETDMGPFDQRTSSEGVFWAEFGELDEEVVSPVVSEGGKLGRVTLNVKILGWIRFKAGDWSTRMHLIRVECMDIKVGFNNTTGVGSYMRGPGSDKCKVDYGN